MLSKPVPIAAGAVWSEQALTVLFARMMASCAKVVGGHAPMPQSDATFNRLRTSALNRRQAIEW